MNSIISLPIPLYSEIQEYLGEAECREFLVISGSQHFREIRKLTLQLTLSRNTYFGFRQRIIETINDSSKQLSLQCETTVSHLENLRRVSIFSPPNTFDMICLSYFENIRRLSVCYAFTVSCRGFRNIVELLINSCSCLINVSELALTPSLEYVSIKNCPFITDISALMNVPSVLFLNLPRVRNISGQLGGEKQVEVVLLEVDVGTEVSRLNRIKKLTISFKMHTTIDFSNFEAIREISIRQCFFTTSLVTITGYCSFSNAAVIHLERCDINSSHLLLFSKVIVLNLGYCQEINDLSPLRNVESLHRITLTSLPNIKDVTMLGYVKYICITNCPIESLKGLKMVRHLLLEKCDELFSLNGIENNVYCSVAYCKKIKNISAFRHCRKISFRTDHISWFNGYFHSNAKLHCSHILLSHPRMVRFNTKFRWNPFMVCLSECHSLAEVERLKTIPVVHIRVCHRLVNISNGLGGNQKVILENCDMLSDISCLSTVPVVQIHNCLGISNYSCLTSVKELRVSWLGLRGPTESVIKQLVDMKALPNKLQRYFPNFVSNYYRKRRLSLHII
jgi:hypothetical protein